MTLKFGYNRGLVEGVKAAWGARLIVTQDGTTDLLWDRQDMFGDDDQRTKLADWLSGNPEVNGNPRGQGALQKARDNASRLLIERTILTSKSRPVVLYQDKEGAVVGNTNGSYGYLYVAAYRFDDLPDGHPTKGLEAVLDDPERVETHVDTRRDVAALVADGKAG